MEKGFKGEFQVRWADLDFNGHMKNTAFLDYAADSRMIFFRQNGFLMSDFAKLQIGPVVFADRINYFSELLMYETFSVVLLLKDLNADGSKFTLLNEIRTSGGKLSARIESEACWLNLKTRKITAPPDNLMDIINRLDYAPERTTPV